MSESQQMSAVDLLDKTLDDLDDLPEFKPYPVGVHETLATMTLKEINDSSVVELSFKLIESRELANSQDEAPKEGAVASTLFYLDNEFGVGNFKKHGASFMAGLGLEAATTNNRELIEQVTDIHCVIVTSLRQDKKDKTVYHLNVKQIECI